MIKKPWYKKGLKFRCEGVSCGDCCSGKWGTGYVWVSFQDIANICEHLGMSVEDFALKYLRQVGRRYALIEKPNLDCIFYTEGEGCGIYEVRPGQCRAYPFWDNIIKDLKRWNEEAHDCPGINAGEEEDIVPCAEIERRRSLYDRDA